MRIGFVVNDIMTEQTGYTTTRLGMWAINRGHDVWVMGLGDFAYDPDESIRARARTVPKKQYKSTEIYLSMLQGKKAVCGGKDVKDADLVAGQGEHGQGRQLVHGAGEKDQDHHDRTADVDGLTVVLHETGHDQPQADGRKADG